MMEIPFWKKFLAALLIYFSFFITGCTSNEVKDYTNAEVPGVNLIASENKSAASSIGEPGKQIKSRARIAYPTDISPMAPYLDDDWAGYSWGMIGTFDPSITGPALPDFQIHQ